MSSREDIPIQMTPNGLYCPAGGFFIDPHRAVDCALITHAHADHAIRGSKMYFCSERTARLMRIRLGKRTPIHALRYGERFSLRGVEISLHPAGHILGSAQVCLKGKVPVTVITGDYNCSDSHAAAEPFEPIECEYFISECTFGLPVYRWKSPEIIREEIMNWVITQGELGRTCFLPSYSLGKTQRILSLLSEYNEFPILVHGPANQFQEVYQQAGVNLGRPIGIADTKTVNELRNGGLVLSSSNVNTLSEVLPFCDLKSGFISGWAQTRYSGDEWDSLGKFVLSDHSDWDGILKAIVQSRASTVGLVHGSVRALGKYVSKEMGLDLMEL